MRYRRAAKRVAKRRNPQPKKPLAGAQGRGAATHGALGRKLGSLDQVVKLSAGSRTVEHVAEEGHGSAYPAGRSLKRLLTPETPTTTLAHRII